jgi:biopolymer transport protein ExbD
MSFSTGNSGQTSEINVTPLIDVLLVLLIIFMVIVPLRPLGLRAAVPQPAARNEPQTPEPSTIVLQVHAGANGAPPTYSINEQAVAKPELVARLTAIFAPRQQRVMFVKGDSDLEFNSVAEAIGFARQAMVTEIGVLTPRAERGSRE